MTATQYINAGPFPRLKGALREWCKVIIQHCNESDWIDVPWWYGERTAVGLFAAALTRDRWLVLEEYATEKIEGASSLPSLNGRQDLLAVKNSWGLVAEAKNNWTRVPNRRGNLKSHLRDLLRHATCDALAKKSFGYKQAAIVFSSPKIRRSDDVSAATREWCRAIRGLKGCARAWLLPKRTATFPRNTEADDKNAGWSNFVFPGTAVIIRDCAKGAD